ncbi:MAG: M20/M25/M40 family metallo-hydrolase [Blastocatellia bacterium]
MVKPSLEFNPKTDSSKAENVKSLLAVLFTLSLIAVALERVRPPAAAKETTSANEFSSYRAKEHLQQIARIPRGMGSLSHTNARKYIIDRLTELGLSPELQSATVINQRPVGLATAASVNNILCKIAGTSNTKAIILVGHYDTVSTSPGASDDGSAVAAMLESIRCLREGQPLSNDVILLFTDGEEAGLLGARAFVEEHPWAKDIGLVINMEARGSGGPAIMFETSDQNGWLIQEYASSALHPIASSLTYSLYKLLPNDTDMTIFKEAGIQGFNFAYIDGAAHYHTAVDDISSLDEQSIQHIGSEVLALTRHFGGLDLRTPGKPDAIYFDLLGGTLVHYSGALALFITVLLALLLIGVIALGVRKKRLTALKISLGLLPLFVSMIVSAGLVMLVWMVVSAVHKQYGLIPNGDTYNGDLYRAAFLFLTFGVTITIYILFRKKISTDNLSMSALVWGFILLVISTLYQPGSSYLLAWPVLFGILWLGYRFLSNDESPISIKSLIIALAISIPAIILFIPVIELVAVALPLDLSAVSAVILVTLLGFLIPVLAIATRLFKWVLPSAAALATIGLLVAGSFSSGFDARHPKPNNLFYALNADSGQARWLSVDPVPDEWTSQFFEDSERKPLTGFLPYVGGNFLQSEAPVLPLAAPTIDLVENSSDGSMRRIKLRIRSPRQAQLITVRLNAEVTEAWINGKRLDTGKPVPQPGSPPRWGFNYLAPPETGIEVVVAVNSSEPIKAEAMDRSYGFDQSLNASFKSRPGYMIASTSLFSDSVLVVKSFVF